MSSQRSQPNIGILTLTRETTGQISASLASLSRTLDDYEEMARRELIPAKKEKAEERVKNFRKEMADYRSHFETLKGERAQAVESPLSSSRRSDANRKGRVD